MDPCALDEEAGEEVHADGLPEAEVGLRGPVHAEHEAAGAGRHHQEAARGALLLLQVAEAVLVVRVALRLRRGRVEHVAVPHHLPAADPGQSQLSIVTTADQSQLSIVTTAGQ